MTDRYLIPVNGVWLALTADQFSEAQSEARTITHYAGLAAAPNTTLEPLLDANSAAEKLCVTSRWLEDMVRQGICPHHRLGRFVRFNVREVAEHFRVAGATPPTDSQSVTPFRKRGNQ